MKLALLALVCFSLTSTLQAQDKPVPAKDHKYGEGQPAPGGAGNPGTGESADEAEKARIAAEILKRYHRAWIGWAKMLNEYSTQDIDYKPFPNVPEPLRAAMLDPNSPKALEKILEKYSDAQKNAARVEITNQYRLAMQDMVKKLDFNKLHKIKQSFDRAKLQDTFRYLTEDRSSFSKGVLKTLIDEVADRVLKIDSAVPPAHDEEKSERELMDTLQKSYFKPDKK